MNKYSLFCTLAVTSLLLSGCSSVKNSLGLNKQAPDEFSVTTRAPLEMPNKLVLPQPKLGTPRPQEMATDKQAKEVLLGENHQKDTGKSSSIEKALLMKSNADSAAPDIRATINKETLELEDRNKPLAEKILNISGNNKRPSATIVDAKKEYERIKKNKEEGKSIIDGDTPTIEE